MIARFWIYIIYITVGIVILRKVQVRLRLSRAKHPSLGGHAKLSRIVAKLIPFYEYSGERIFVSDGAPAHIASQREAGFERLSQLFFAKAPKSLAMTRSLESAISDVNFTNAYRVPFQYRNYVRKHLHLGGIVNSSKGTMIEDLDGNWSFDLTGSYGVNVFGYDIYKSCLEKGYEQVKDLGPVLGPYHPVIVDNVNRLRSISGLDEVSFHMSGTEAVMQAVRLARYHTGRTHLVRFCGAYHGWWDGVQPGIGNGRKTQDVYTLSDMSDATLKVLKTRKDIACVLINPLQALHPNSNAPSDAMLVNSERNAHFDRKSYADWLQTLRNVCSERKIVLILDEVFMGFRLAYGGAQEYFNIQADLVTYGKTLGGGLPVGVLCGKHHLMKRYRDERPTDVSFARGTFNSHPYVMASMNEFLKYIDTPEVRKSYILNEQIWNNRAEQLNNRMIEKGMPVRVANMSSVWTIIYTRPCRYNWMFQYYLRAQGLAISWVGSGRVIFSHNFNDEDYEQVLQRFLAAAQAMNADGWWWHSETLTNRSIKKQIFRELIATVFG